MRLAVTAYASRQRLMVLMSGTKRKNAGTPAFAADNDDYEWEVSSNANMYCYLLWW
jgi:hypothetical protein